MMQTPRRISGLTAALLVGGTIVIIVVSVFLAVSSRDKLDFLMLALFGLLGGLTVAFAVCLVFVLFRGDVLSLESRGSGFGGNLGGWRASAALGLLVAALVFGCLTVVAARMILTYDHNTTGATSESTAIPTATAQPSGD